MAERRRSLLADLEQEIGSLAGELKEMATLRWELARLELRAAVASIRRLAIAWLVFGLMALTSLPILAVAAAAWLGDLEAVSEGISFTGWLLFFGVGLLVVGLAGGFLAWSRFRRRFVLLEQTLEELREDLVWLREWAGGEQGRRGE